MKNFALIFFLIAFSATAQQVDKPAGGLPSVNFVGPTDSFLVSTGITARSTRLINTSNLLESLVAETNWAAHIQTNSALSSTTNVSFYLTSSNGLFNVFQTNGNLLLSVSNNQITIYTNLTVNGLFTLNSPTNVDWVSNFWATGWLTVQGGETNKSILGPGLIQADSGGGQSLATVGSGLSLSGSTLANASPGVYVAAGTGISANTNAGLVTVSNAAPGFPMTANGNAQGYAITNLGQIIIGNSTNTGLLVMTTNGLVFYSTNATAFDVNREGTNGSPNYLSIRGTNSFVLLSTNLVAMGTTNFINGFTVFSNGLSGNITGAVYLASGTAAAIDATTPAVGLANFALDANRLTIGNSGGTAGGIPVGVRYVNDLTNWSLGMRTGELAVTTGQKLPNTYGNATETTLWINSGGGASNNIPLIGIQGTIGTKVFAIAQTPAIELSYGSYGGNSDGSTYGLPGAVNLFRAVAGAGGYSASGGHGGNGGAIAGVYIAGGAGGVATNANSVGGNGGNSGGVQLLGGQGGRDWQAFAGAFGGPGGAAGSIYANGGAGSDDGASFNGQPGGAAGGINLNGGDAPNTDATGGMGGGNGGSLSALAIGTNSAGSLQMSGANNRVGGNITSFASTYIPAAIFTTTTSAGIASATTGSLLGTAQFLASPKLHLFSGDVGQNQGAVISSNTVDHIGRTLRLSAWGYAVTNGTPTLRIQVTLGGTTVVDTGTQTISSITTTQGWRFQAEIPFRTTGASGTCLGQGKLEYGTSATAQSVLWATQTATTTIDTTKDEAIGLTATMSTGSGNVFICTGATAELIN